MPALPDDQRALLAAVIAAPDDDTPRLVYADWLDDHGDPVQADYIRESVRLATLPPDDPDRPGIEERLTAVIRDRSDGWADALGLSSDVARLYRRGFAHTIEFRSLAGYFRHGLAWCGVAPVGGLAYRPHRDSHDGWIDGWERFAGSPDLTSVRALTISDLWLNDDGWRVLLANPATAGLRELEVPGCAWGVNELGLLAEQPHLARLERLDLGDADADRLVGALRPVMRSPHLAGLRAVYFGSRGAGDPFVQRELNARYGDRWGNRRPLPPVWC